MKLDDNILKIEEKIMYELRSLYHKSGYAPFKMSRFEEYDMYVKNKSYISDTDIVTFTDLTGKLLALKPDVTLSIIKNYKPVKGSISKVYYNENVYRTDRTTHEINEIMQTGIECMGDISMLDECEVILLAVKSLEAISENYILDISSAKILNGLLDASGADSDTRKSIIKLFASKNTPALTSLCAECGIGGAISDIMIKLCSLSGKATEKIQDLEKLCINRDMTDACNELKVLINALSECVGADKLNLDFSIISNANYYSGVVFRGYVDKLPESVLSGGRYDNLIKSMGKKGSAIGFAVYSDMLERLDERVKEYDCDVLLTYEDGVTYAEINSAAEKFKADGLSVNVQKTDCGVLRYKKCYKLGKGGEING